MPVAIPIIAAFASGAVGAVIAGTATFAAYATVAGAVLSVAGAVTHNKDLMRIGAIVGVVGGIANLAQGAAEGASAASQNAASAANEAQVTADAAANGADAVAKAVPVTPPPAEVANLTGEVGSGVQPPTTGPPPVTDPTSVAPSLAQQAATPTAAPTTPVSGTAPITPAQAVAQSGVPGTELPSGTDLAGDAGRYGSNSVANAAKQFTSSDLNSWWDKAMKTGKGVSKFMNDNKEVVNLAGGALKDMYGPQAEALDYQKSLMEQARRNINSPVVLQLRKA